MTRARSGVARLEMLALGVVLALATSGCAAAGLAGAPLMSAVQLIGDRTVDRTMAADLAEAQGATETVLARMAFRLESRERNEGVRRLRAVADGVTVYARLERVTAKLTRIGLRVEAGRMVADRDTGTQMQEQIAALLAPRTVDPAAAEALTTLKAEIHKLRSDMGERRAAEAPVPARETGTSASVKASAVVTAPMSAALPTVGGPAPSVSVAVPATATGPAVPSVSSRPEVAPAMADARTAAALHPAGALTPIQPTTGVGSGN